MLIFLYMEICGQSSVQYMSLFNVNILTYYIYNYLIAISRSIFIFRYIFSNFLCILKERYEISFL